MAQNDFAVIGDNPVALDEGATVDELRKYDHLGFFEFVAPFAKRIRASRGNTPFTVGIYAPWGQGKTSLMQLLRRLLELDEDGNPDPSLMTVWFDPWKYHSREEAWRGLALTLVEAVRENDTLIREIKRKTPAIKKSVAKGLWVRLFGKWGGELVDSVAREPWNPSHLHRFEQDLKILFKALKPSGTMLVLFIDDLDRCLAEPAAAMLEAFKLVLDHEGIVTVMGVDQGELAKTIGNLYRGETGDGNGADDAGYERWGRKYLAKFIQVPFDVPYVAPSAFDRYISECLKDGRLADVLPRSERWYPLVRRACGGNLREVKRFVNRFVSEWDKAKANVSLSEDVAVSRMLDVPRVAFMLLLDIQNPELLPHCRRQSEPEETFFELQRHMLRTESPGEPPESLAEWLNDPGLGTLFHACLLPSEGEEERAPLVKPFEYSHQIGIFLSFGRREIKPEISRQPDEEGVERERKAEGDEVTKAATEKPVEARKETGKPPAKPALKKARHALETDLKEVRALMLGGALSEAEGRLESLWSKADGDAGRAEIAALLAENTMRRGNPIKGVARFRNQVGSLARETTIGQTVRLLQFLGELLEDPAAFGGKSELRDDAGRALAQLFLGTLEDDIVGFSTPEEAPANQIITDLLLREPVLGTPDSRALLGRVLGRLGDPRPGIGCTEDSDSGLMLPVFDWVEIPGGVFPYGDEQERIDIEGFRIACYPVTHTQFQAFIDDPEGYSNPEWWKGLDAGPEKPDEASWPIPNHPRETVNWFEAMAFCAWASKRLGYDIRLPKEQEWERAAAGAEGREYPWGDGYEPGCANVHESNGSYLERTAAVGLYPSGCSPEEGIWDLAGNVWEWCLNEYDQPENTQSGGENPRVVRGGAWGYNPLYARARVRFRFVPDDRGGSLGFRVLSSSPILQAGR